MKKALLYVGAGIVGAATPLLNKNVRKELATAMKNVQEKLENRKK